MRTLLVLLFSLAVLGSTSVTAACAQAGEIFGGLDRLREFLRRVQEILVLGGVALALLGTLVFILSWALSHVRRATDHSRPLLSRLVLALAYVPVLLTVVAGAGLFLPNLAPLILKAFALAIAAAAVVWCLALGLILAGGSRRDLARARKAIVLAGTPWYCLVVYMATFL
ncbi:MAG TPA: hypothetical protein VIK91_06290 [Nannocystis sp.]